LFDLVHLDIWRPIATPSLHGHKYFLIVPMKLKSKTVFLVLSLVNLI